MSQNAIPFASTRRRRQSRRVSALETVTSTAAGFGLSLATQIVVFPAMGIAATFRQDVELTIIFTALSLLRGYAIRRLFEVLG